MSNTESTLFPVLQGVRQQDSNEVVLQLFITEELAYLNGHFDQIAIVPGVTQIHWAVFYARQNINKLVDRCQLTHDLLTEQTCLDGFYEMQVIKFKNLIFPKAMVNLNLRYMGDCNKLYFRFYSESQEFSSGRLYFRST